MSTKRLLQPLHVEKQGFTFLEAYEEVRQALTKASTTFADSIVRIGEGGPFDLDTDQNQKDIQDACPSVMSLEILQFKGHFQGIEDKSNGFSVELKDENEAKVLFEHAKDKACLVVVFLKQGLVLGVKSKIERIQKGVIFFSEPLRIFKLQRRKDMRWNIGWGYEIQLSVAVPRMIQGPFLVQRFRILNLSRSGLSFLVESKSQADLINGGMILRNLGFTAQGSSFQFDAVTRSKRVHKHPKYGTSEGYAIGVEFVRPDKELAELLEELVMSQTAHLLM